MKIRLLQLDGKFPNIALMKISTYYKQKGCDVDWYEPVFDQFDTDKLYVSKIFDFTPEYHYYPNETTTVIEKGGTGFDIYKMLPDEIESVLDLDYTLYPDCDYSVQFYSRGCPKNCAFCVVPDKEGGIIATRPYSLNPNGKWIEVLDNNFFASPRWEDAIKDMIKIGQPVNFHGVQLETLNEHNAKYINKLKLHKQIKIAWDDPKDRPQEKMRNLIKYIKAYKLMCYVLIGFNSTHEENLYRVMELKEIGIDPFAMPYDKSNDYQRHFTRWVNHKAVFKTVTWEEYAQSVKLDPNEWR